MKNGKMLAWVRSLLVSDRNKSSGNDRADSSDVSRLTDAETRSEFSHELYIDSSNLTAALTDCAPTRSLEIGCGYGRLTPWIADMADEHCAIDLSDSLLAAARREYGGPALRFQRARAESLPFLENAFDLAVTWGVLNHVPSDAIGAAADEIDRVVAPDGTLVISEATDGKPDPRWEYRSIEEWRSLFAPRELVWHAHTERDEEPFRDPEREHVVMKFR